jgi:hypothetical protein
MELQFVDRTPHPLSIKALGRNSPSRSTRTQVVSSNWTMHRSSAILLCLCKSNRSHFKFNGGGFIMNDDGDWTDCSEESGGNQDDLHVDEDGDQRTIGNGLDEAIDSVAAKHGLNGTLPFPVPLPPAAMLG